MTSCLLVELFQEQQQWLTSHWDRTFLVWLEPRVSHIMQNLNMIKLNEKEPCCVSGIVTLGLWLMQHLSTLLWAALDLSTLFCISEHLRQRKSDRSTGLWNVNPCHHKYLPNSSENLRHGLWQRYINLIWVHCELLELLYAKSYTLCWANDWKSFTALC